MPAALIMQKILRKLGTYYSQTRFDFFHTQLGRTAQRSAGTNEIAMRQHQDALLFL